jgi:hypothetical protein
MLAFKFERLEEKEKRGGDLQTAALFIHRYSDDEL